MRRVAKVDANQQQIIGALRARGFSVHDTHSLGSGFPDIVVGCNGLNFFFEIKTASGRMTRDEIRFMHEWRGQYQVVRSDDQAICAIERILLEQFRRNRRNRKDTQYER